VGEKTTGRGWEHRLSSWRGAVSAQEGSSPCHHLRSLGRASLWETKKDAGLRGGISPPHHFPDGRKIVRHRKELGEDKDKNRGAEESSPGDRVGNGARTDTEPTKIRPNATNLHLRTRRGNINGSRFWHATMKRAHIEIIKISHQVGNEVVKGQGHFCHKLPATWRGLSVGTKINSPLGKAKVWGQRRNTARNSTRDSTDGKIPQKLG